MRENCSFNRSYAEISQLVAVSGPFLHLRRLHAMRILVVEDEEHVVSAVRKGLESEGYAVDTASDGSALVCH
jgi:PleD family two-component response regulator